MEVIPLSKREEILKSASCIALKGPANLTLDAVAREAGMSKGGLLYHFPSKELLVQAMVTDLIEQMTESLFLRVKQDEISEGKWCRAYAQEMFSRFGDLGKTNAGFLAAVATNPELLKPIQERYRLWQEQMGQDGIDPVYATIVRLVADGIKFNALFGMPPLEEGEQNQLLDVLLRLTFDNREDGNIETQTVHRD